VCIFNRNGASAAGVHAGLDKIMSPTFGCILEISNVACRASSLNVGGVVVGGDCNRWPRSIGVT